MSEHERVDVEALRTHPYSPLPWSTDGVSIYDGAAIGEVVVDECEHRYDARFIVAAVNALPALLDAHDGLVAEVERLRAALTANALACGREAAPILAERDQAQAVAAKVRELAEKPAPHALSDQAQVPYRMAMAKVLALLPDDEGSARLPLHRTETGYPNCSTCGGGGGCSDCTDPA